MRFGNGDGDGLMVARVRGVLVGVVVLFVAWVVVVLVGGGAARATTSDNVGLPAPKKLMLVKDGDPFIGRFYLTSVARSARIVGGQLDIEVQGEGEPEWFYGELQLRLYTSTGKLSTTVLSVWEFRHADGHVSAELIPPATITEQHPDGVSAGRVSFVLPKGYAGISNHAKELKQLTGEMTFEGHTFQVGLTRTSDDSPVLGKLPTAKQVGK